MAKLRRLLISTDGDKWYVRRIASVTHDGTHDAMIYKCDQPIGINFKSLPAAIRKAKDVLSNKNSRAWR